MSQFIANIPSIAESVEILLIAMSKDEHADPDKMMAMTTQCISALEQVSDYAKHLDELNHSQQE